jgi:hypothetical protein
MQINGPVGPDYILQAAATLGTNIAWVSLLTNTPAASPSSITDSNAGGFATRFYREKLGP